MKIILGSSSPRRKEILSRIICSFDIIKPETDESVHAGETPLDYALRVASDKSRAVMDSCPCKGPGFLLITCDTIVAIQNRIIGKPENFDDALSILKDLSGKTHEVISALTLLYAGNKTIIRTEAEKTLIRFKNLNEKELKNYLMKIDFMDKAGAYALQEYGDVIIEEVRGSITNVIGFPLRLFIRMIGEMDIAGPALFNTDKATN